MGHWDDEPMWEPSEADELFDEIKSKLINAAKHSLKCDIETLESENERLRKRNQELENKIHEVSKKENELNRRMENLEREVKQEFYKKNVEDVMNEWLDHIEVWYAEYIPYEKPKCNMCNEDRKMVAVFPDGTQTTCVCSCQYPNHVYEPRISRSTSAKFHKSKGSGGGWGNGYLVYLTRSYQPDQAYVDAYNCYNEFRVNKVFDKFDDEAKKYHQELGYRDHLAFETQEECQKYCDWLNQSKKEEEV